MRRLIDWILGRPSPIARIVQPAGDAEFNLAAHPQVRLAPVATTRGAISVPIWFDFAPNSTKPATYDGVFWEIEPMGEHLYFLAGDFAKNEKGLLRFGAASLEIRAERNFELDVINVARSDGDGAQSRASHDKPWVGMSVAEACAALAPDPQGGLDDVWTGLFKPSAADMQAGRARMMLGYHWRTGAPFLELLEERDRPAAKECPYESIFQLRTICRDPDRDITDVIALHADVAARYVDTPWRRVGGATRM